MNKLSSFCQEIYYGMTQRALRARYGLVALDLLIIAYFMVTTFLPAYGWIVAVDMVIGVILIVDLLGRVAGNRDRWAYLTRPMALVDVVVIVSLFVPAMLGNFAFLRVVRAMRLMRSFVIVRQLRNHSRFFAVNEDVLFSALNLIVFVFVVAAAVFVLQAPVNESINTYIDALYFTITTLTTTGFGDITLVGSTGRMLAVVIMIVGVALFIRLAQTIFRPSKVRYECEDCGLTRHDLDAVHCKHCGQQLHIRTKGAVG